MSGERYGQCSTTDPGLCARIVVEEHTEPYQNSATVLSLSKFWGVTSHSRNPSAAASQRAPDEVSPARQERSGSRDHGKRLPGLLNGEATTCPCILETELKLAT
jgi:hypothetical protein